MRFTRTPLMAAATGAALSLALALPALAAGGTPFQTRGTLMSLMSDQLSMQTPDGSPGIVLLGDHYRLIGEVKASLADIRPGDFVGVGSVPDGHGGQRAVEVTIFPKSMAGTGEGSRAWALAPQGLMTNAVVESRVEKMRGDVLTLTYKGGQQRVTVPKEAPVVELTPAKHSDLKPGAGISVHGEQGSDGMVTVHTLVVGLNGFMPPM
ncbi:hypothetical protein FGG78_27590 [Thioclava sp. BHET1]|nr:hypothetical protein FGG78_27590 [Thioclava sp. BHET1]